MKYTTREQQVEEFLAAAGDDKLTIDLALALYLEESDEFIDALNDWELSPSEATRCNLVKEWADMQYTLSQLAIALDIDGEEAFDRVAFNNMSKVVGGVKRRADGKIMKPDGYEKPDMRGL